MFRSLFLALVLSLSSPAFCSDEGKAHCYRNFLDWQSSRGGYENALVLATASVAAACFINPLALFATAQISILCGGERHLAEKSHEFYVSNMKRYFNIDVTWGWNRSLNSDHHNHLLRQHGH